MCKYAQIKNRILEFIFYTFMHNDNKLHTKLQLQKNKNSEKGDKTLNNNKNIQTTLTLHNVTRTCFFCTMTTTTTSKQFTKKNILYNSQCNDLITYMHAGFHTIPIEMQRKRCMKQRL